VGGVGGEDESVVVGVDVQEEAVTEVMGGGGAVEEATTSGGREGRW
jgi:hypothetical protein